MRLFKHALSRQRRKFSREPPVLIRTRKSRLAKLSKAMGKNLFCLRREQILGGTVSIDEVEVIAREEI